MIPDWQTTATAKRDAVIDLIPPKWRIERIPTVDEQKDVTGEYVQQFLNKKEIEITETDAVDLAEKLAAGEWSAVDVTEAFCHRAALAHQLLNCLHEIFFDAALADAKALDIYFAENKKTKGPLHGVPVSLKDQFHVKNVETTMGYVGWIGTHEGKTDSPKYKTFESELVRELRELGAILYCKTSVPHTLMTGETINNIIGYTWNPKNRHLASGGSSGGEGALIGLKGSPLGLGTDIGGSVRIPSAFNGLYGLRPSVGRIPYEGMANSIDGQNSVLSVVGPLGTTVRSIRLLTKSILSAQPWRYDPAVVELPWRQDKEDEFWNTVNTAQGQLSFGLMKTDNVVNPQPPVARAIDMVVKAVEKAGHKVMLWEDPNLQNGLATTFNTWGFDGGKDLRDAFALSGETASKQISNTLGDANKDEKTATFIMKNNIAQRQWKKDFVDLWNSTASATETGNPIDAIIAPVAPYPAARPEKYKWYAYTAWVNGLDLTSVVVPVTIADKSVDVYEKGYKPLGKDDQTAHDDYDAEMYDGAHVAIQLVGRRFQEEKMLALAEYLSQILRPIKP